jgi:hypothetical protein
MKTGEPAFPLFAATGHSGMTLRDYFAAHAMKTIFDFRHRELLQLNEAMGGPESMSFSEDERHSEVAEEAYLMADAMLKAREK